MLLFAEKEFIDYDVNKGIGPTGWLSRYPFFYDFYTHYSYANTSKELNFYDVMISKDTYFLGYKSKVYSHFIDYYNNLDPVGWHHAINVVEYVGLC